MFIKTDVCPRAGDIILDLGCGTGDLSAYLAELVGPNGKVVAVDPDKDEFFWLGSLMVTSKISHLWKKALQTFQELTHTTLVS